MYDRFDEINERDLLNHILRHTRGISLSYGFLMDLFYELAQQVPQRELDIFIHDFYSRFGYMIDERRYRNRFEAEFILSNPCKEVVFPEVKTKPKEDFLSKKDMEL